MRLLSCSGPQSGRDPIRGEFDLRAGAAAAAPGLWDYLPQDFGVTAAPGARDLLDHLAVLKGLALRAERARRRRMLAQVTSGSARPRAGGPVGGMRRRFGIAQAMIGGAPVWSTRPTAALDTEERNRCSNMLAAVGEKVAADLDPHRRGRVAVPRAWLCCAAGGSAGGARRRRWSSLSRARLARARSSAKRSTSCAQPLPVI
jgi:hypothetical protein